MPDETTCVLVPRGDVAIAVASHDRLHDLDFTRSRSIESIALKACLSHGLRTIVGDVADDQQVPVHHAMKQSAIRNGRPDKYGEASQQYAAIERLACE